MSPITVSFVLPVSGGSGGANSVIQEACGLSKLGLNVKICVNEKNLDSLIINYPQLSTGSVKVASYENVTALSKHISDTDAVVATVNNSVYEIEDAMATISALNDRKLPRVLYYVQDYEPLFYEYGTDAWQRAYLSYKRIQGAVLFAKTKWLQDIVYNNHGIRVAKVSPSIDHDIYFSGFSDYQGPLRISAMLRPKTPRRAPIRTIRILRKLHDMYGSSVSLSVFGSHDEELRKFGMEIPDFIVNHGRLKRHEVPDIFRQLDLFLDLSDYQAFGRTGLEAMACGVVPVVPSFGGYSEYARHGDNSYVVDTRNDVNILSVVEIFKQQSQRSREAMQQSALETASNFTVHKAALSEMKLLKEVINQF